MTSARRNQRQRERYDARRVELDQLDRVFREIEQGGPNPNVEAAMSSKQETRRNRATLA